MGDSVWGGGGRGLGLGWSSRMFFSDGVLFFCEVGGIMVSLRVSRSWCGMRSLEEVGRGCESRRAGLGVS